VSYNNYILFLVRCKELLPFLAAIAILARICLYFDENALIFNALLGMRRVHVVRHAEREDNVNKKWRLLYPNFTYDNTPLSNRGRSQALELQRYFAPKNIDNIYASPFDRTMETADILLGSHPNAINVEPGLCEVLYLCAKPPGFWSTDKLKEKFPRVNMNYYPACPPHTLSREDGGDEACIPRVSRAIRTILANDRSQSIVLVSHGATIAGIHFALGYDFTHVGQATVTIFDELEPGRFHLIQSGDSTHLTGDNRRNLRAY